MHRVRRRSSWPASPLQDAERSQSDLGVPVALSARRAVRNAGGRGVLEDQGGGRGRPGEHEMMPRGVSADDEDNEDEPLLPSVKVEQLGGVPLGARS